MTRSRGLIVWSIAAVVLVFAAYWIGERFAPRDFDGLQLAYLALAVMIPLFVYLFSVGHMAVVGSDAAAGGETAAPAADIETAATAAEPSSGTPAVFGMSGATDPSDD